MTDRNQTDGRKGNAAQPLGERSGLVSNAATVKTGKKERRSAGPDGPDATETTEAITKRR